MKYININGKNIAYNQSGNGTPIVFLHGNPTSSYLWRNITPHLESVASCFVFDLIGMGKSDKLDNSGPNSYKFEEHFHYINQAIEKVIPNEKITLVLHDWGSALGFHWAFQNQNRIEGIAYMEGIVKELKWDEWNEQSRIYIGQKLQVPNEVNPQISPLVEFSADPQTPVDFVEVVIKWGDTLSEIAAEHGIKTSELMAANGIEDASRIFVGFFVCEMIVENIFYSLGRLDAPVSCLNNFPSLNLKKDITP